MKTLITLVALSLTSTAAFAAPITCESNGATEKNAYYASISGDHRTAKITKVAGEKSTVIARLQCTKAHLPGPNGDRRSLLLQCAPIAFRGASYALDVYTGGLAGGVSARLNSITFRGTKLLKNMTCFVAENQFVSEEE